MSPESTTAVEWEDTISVQPSVTTDVSASVLWLSLKHSPACSTGTQSHLGMCIISMVKLIQNK